MIYKINQYKLPTYKIEQLEFGKSWKEVNRFRIIMSKGHSVFLKWIQNLIWLNPSYNSFWNLGLYLIKLTFLLISLTSSNYQHSICPINIAHTTHIDEDCYRFHFYDTVWMHHPSFQAPEASSSIPSANIGGLIYLQLTLLIDSGCAVNILCPSVIKATKATPLAENHPRIFQTIAGYSKEYCHYLEPICTTETGTKINLQPFLIRQQPLTQKTNANELNEFIKTHLTCFIETNHLPTINPLSSAPTIHGIVGIDNLDYFGTDHTAKFPILSNKYPMLRIFKSKLNNLHFISGTVPKAIIPQNPLKIFSPVCQLSTCCIKTLASNLINDVQLNSLGCEDHQYSPLCKNCCEANGERKSDISWDEACNLVEFQTNSDGSKTAIARYAWIQDPKMIFCTSNYTSAKQHAIKEHKSLLNKFGKNEGIKIIQQQIEKYTATGAYQILTQKEAKNLLLTPHHFIRTSLIENHRSKSTPLRTILDPSSYVKECKSSFNANLVTLPTKQTNISFILLGFFLYEYPLSQDIESAFHGTKLIKSDQLFQLIMSFDFTKENWTDHPVIIRVLSLIFGSAQSPTLMEITIRKICQFLEPPYNNILKHQRMVDNILTSFRDIPSLKKTEQIFTKIFNKHGFKLKPSDTSEAVSKISLSKDQEIEQILGIMWNKKQDTIGPNYNFNIGKK